MNRILSSMIVACLAIAGCDPDTTPSAGGPSESDAAAGSAGAAGTGGSGGTSGGGAGGAAGEQDAAPDGEDGDAQPEAGEEAGDAGGAGGSAGGSGYSHTITIDGTNDFDPAKDKFDSSSMNPDAYQGYVAWDANFLYLGMDGKAIGDKSGMDWIVVYIGGAPGGKTGIGYGAQTAPGLPMDCKYHVRWKADGTYTNAQKWNGSGWADVVPNWGIQQASKGTFAELALSRIDFDFPAKVQIVFSMLREAAGNEWTWASVPSNSITDGKGVSYTKYFEFDFSSAAAPNAATPLP